MAFETDSAGTIGLKYVWGAGTDNLLAVRDANDSTFYVVSDKLGSVRGLARRDGTWIGTLRYDPYGTAIDSAGSAMGLRYRWTGREWDAETGFYFHRARYYDPGAKRFITEDPIGYGGGGNLYSYVAGAVLETRDPSGLMAEDVPPAMPGLVPPEDWNCVFNSLFLCGLRHFTGGLGFPVVVADGRLRSNYQATVDWRGRITLTYTDYRPPTVPVPEDYKEAVRGKCDNAACDVTEIHYGASPWAEGNTIHLPGRLQDIPWVDLSYEDQALIAEELYHSVVHRRTMGGAGYYLTGFFQQVLYLRGWGYDVYNWPYGFDRLVPFGNIGMEAQGRAFGECVAGNPLACAYGGF